MDALMAALVAALLIGASDATPRLAAALARRHGALRVISATALAFAAGHALAAAGGATVAATLTPAAARLLLGLALVVAGGTALFPARRLDRLEGWRLNGWLTAFLGMFVLAFGDSAQFVTAALAAGSPWPALAATGATLGSMAAIAPAVLLRDEDWAGRWGRWLRWGVAGVLLPTGAILALGGLRLI